MPILSIKKITGEGETPKQEGRKGGDSGSSSSGNGEKEQQQNNPNKGTNQMQEKWQ